MVIAMERNTAFSEVLRRKSDFNRSMRSFTSAELRKPWKKSALLKCICCLQNIVNLTEWEQSILYRALKSKKRNYLYFTTLLPPR